MDPIVLVFLATPFCLLSAFYLIAACCQLQSPSGSSSGSATVSAAQQRQFVPGTVVVIFQGGKVDCCCICLEEYKEGDKCKILSKCKHLYHDSCIEEWLLKGRNCPVCRDSVRGVPVTVSIDDLNQLV
ncbi:hypothetical protein JCGZ_11085 [Jatropha curcas]|uniref:RING-type domain-containing protein n=1 Tax=Jatropha curcas TaxID=180498 RepID=A0A067KQF9_JATCU|nr:hypothetical protein JCGZ_11085 [Jatropha curcas]